MHSGSARLATGLLLLAGLWIFVYWWWPSAPPVTFAGPETSGAAEHVQRPDGESPPAPEGGSQAPEVPAPEPSRAERPEPVPPAVIPPEFFDHTVAKGETLEDISKRYFGTTRHAGAIARSNPLLSPANIREGRVIRVPRDPENIQGIPTVPEAPAPAGRTYVVKAGDSLSKISKAMYGTTRHARLIFEANRDQLKDEDSISLGQTLVIPPQPKE
ncbi:MAG: LysM peptidoglycan-binding domain-containing protein [Leptolyngbya sp. PLA1]|nr:LysM peptidoglycan-binding domain-containing protein [Leptolyngbya sp. PLA1]